MVKRSNEGKGRRSTDKEDKLTKYTDLCIKLIITGLIAYGVSNITTMSSDIAVIKVSYQNNVQRITENKMKNKEQDVCLKDHEKRLIIIEKS